MQIQVQGRELINTVTRLRSEGRTIYALHHKTPGHYVLDVSEPHEQQADFADVGISGRFDAKKSRHDERSATFTSDALP